MTSKCCSKCVKLRGRNLEQTGRLCAGIPAVGLFNIAIRNDALDTFYCGEFSPAEHHEEVPDTQIPTIQRRFV